MRYMQYKNTSILGVPVSTDWTSSVVKTDDEIISLRNNIRKSAEVKVENGTLTVTDLLRELNAESQARQSKSLHEIQLYIAVYQQLNTTNN